MQYMFKDTLLAAKKDGALSGYFPAEEKVTMLTDLPSVSWDGAKISWAQWQQILSFFEAVYAKHQSEATCRLYLDSQKNTWSVSVHPQTVSGASADEDKTLSPKEAKEVALESRGILVGTIHSHAAMGAFQSGGDAKDEVEGLHMTVGSFDTGERTIHLRFVRNGLNYPTPFFDWVARPLEPKITDLPKALELKLLQAIDAFYLAQPATHKLFPPAWMDRVRTSKYFGSNDSGHWSQGTWYRGLSESVESKTTRKHTPEELVYTQEIGKEKDRFREELEELLSISTLSSEECSVILSEVLADMCPAQEMEESVTHSEEMEG